MPVGDTHANYKSKFDMTDVCESMRGARIVAPSTLAASNNCDNALFLTMMDGGPGLTIREVEVESIEFPSVAVEPSNTGGGSLRRGRVVLTFI